MEKKRVTDELNLRLPLVVEHHSEDAYWKIVGRHQHHDALEIILLEKGSGTFFTEKKAQVLHSGDYRLINKDEYHHCEIENSFLDMTIIKINLNVLRFLCPTGPAAELIKKICYSQIYFENYPDDPEIYGDIQKTSALFRENVTDETLQIKLLSLALDILYLLKARHISYRFSEKKARLLGENRQIFYQLTDYMEQNYTRRITLEEVAEIAGVSKGYFCAKFKHYTGRSFVEYLNILRIEKSLPLLSDHTLSVTEVAFSAGFEDVNYFCRVFKKYMGQSPSVYRKKSGR